MDLAKVSDVDLMVELIDADRELALETLYYRYNEMLRTMLRVRCLVPGGEKDDFLQMVWVKVLACFDTYDPTISTQSWLFKIATGVVIKDFENKRCLKRSPPGNMILTTDFTAPAYIVDESTRLNNPEVKALEPTEDHRLPKPTTDPAELLMVRDQLRMVLEAVEEMGQLQSDVIRYVCIEGLSYEEAAGILGLSRDVLSATLYRVRDKLSRKKNLAA